MASPLTRSSRRSEGLTTRSSTRSNVAVHPANHNNNAHKRQQPVTIGLKKRRRDPIDHEDQSIIAKKARIAIEISSRTKVQPKTRSLVIKSNVNSGVVAQRPATPSKQAASATQTETPLPLPQKATDHHQKVAKGIKHELHRLQANTVLQANPADLKDEKRKLRSQEGSRFKSELSLYFPEYDEVIGNEAKEDHMLNLDTPMIIVDSAKISKQPTLERKSNDHEYLLRDFPDSIFDNLHNAQRVDFSFLDKHYQDEGGEDPLSDAYFELIHKKPERLEKTIRNTDRGRAQHEKDQVIRLLEGLQGHDWLKLLGVSGITDSKKKEYEPAREYFVKGCQAIIEKFRTWREEEKRRKLEKELAVAEADVTVEGQEEEDDGNVSDGDPPDYSDVDASAARQLQEEAIACSGPLTKVMDRRANIEGIASGVQVLEKDFKSFFPKPYLREAALGKHRRSGRIATAWGHPVPEVPDTDFELPEEFRDEKTLKVHARRKRRVKRISKI